jgi:hypothetical protein
MKGELKPVLDEDGYAFVVGPLDGPHSMIWRLWADRKSNVYLTPRPPAGQKLRLKVSFHTPTDRWPLGARSEGLTTEFFKEAYPGEPVRLRHQRSWEGDVPIPPNFQLAYRLVFPRAHLGPVPYPPDAGRRVWWLDIPWPEPATPHQSFALDLVFQTSGDPPSTGNMPELELPDALSGVAGSWALRDGRKVHLVNRAADQWPLQQYLFRPAAEAAAAALDQAAKAGTPPPHPRFTLFYDQPPSLRGCIETSWGGIGKLLAELPGRAATPEGPAA